MQNSADSLPSPIVDSAGMFRVCAKCRTHYPLDLKACPADGTPLAAGEVTIAELAEKSVSISVSMLADGQSPAASASHQLDAGDELPAGAVVGDFEVISTLGAGGGGTVYAARHREIGKKAAVKVIHRELVRDAAAIQRFLDEARTVNAIGHPALEAGCGCSPPRARRSSPSRPGR